MLPLRTISMLGPDSLLAHELESFTVCFVFKEFLSFLCFIISLNFLSHNSNDQRHFDVSFAGVLWRLRGRIFS